MASILGWPFNALKKGPFRVGPKGGPSARTSWREGGTAMGPGDEVRLLVRPGDGALGGGGGPGGLLRECQASIDGNRARCWALLLVNCRYQISSLS